MPRTWRPFARVVVDVKEFGTLKIVVDAEFAIWNADLPADCSSQMVSLEYGEVVLMHKLPPWKIKLPAELIVKAVLLDVAFACADDVAT